MVVRLAGEGPLLVPRPASPAGSRHQASNLNKGSFDTREYSPISAGEAEDLPPSCCNPAVNTSGSGPPAAREHLGSLGRISERRSTRGANGLAPERGPDVHSSQTRLSNRYVSVLRVVFRTAVVVDRNLTGLKLRIGRSVRLLERSFQSRRNGVEGHTSTTRRAWTDGSAVGLRGGDDSMKGTSVTWRRVVTEQRGDPERSIHARRLEAPGSKRCSPGETFRTWRLWQPRGRS